MIIVKDVIQGSQEWFDLKIGKPSASTFSKLVTSQGKKSSSFRSEAFKKAGEIISGKIDDTFKSEWMKRGTAMEPEARNYYKFITGLEFEEVGLIFKDEKKEVLCSPDGIELNKMEGLEIKNRCLGVQTEHLHNNKLPTIAKPQVYGSLWVCDYIEKWTYLSYNPDLDPLIITTTRDDPGYKVYSEALEKFIPEFNALVKKIVSKIKGK